MDGKTAELKRLRENLIEQKSERESFEKELEKATYELGTKNDQLTLLSDQVASKDTELQQLQNKVFLIVFSLFTVDFCRKTL